MFCFSIECEDKPDVDCYKYLDFLVLEGRFLEIQNRCNDEYMASSCSITCAKYCEAPCETFRDAQGIAN